MAESKIKRVQNLKFALCSKTVKQTNSAYVIGNGFYRVNCGWPHDYNNFPSSYSGLYVIPLGLFKEEDLSYTGYIHSPGYDNEMWGVIDALNKNYTAEILVIYY